MENDLVPVYWQLAADLKDAGLDWGIVTVLLSSGTLPPISITYLQKTVCSC